MNTQQRKMLGLDTEADKLVTLPVRHWEALKLALWRSRVAWDAVLPQARLLLEHCGHVAGCPGLESEIEPCGPHCPDRERRLSVLVILAACRQFGPVDVHKPADAPYIAPSRERFSEVLAALTVAQAELEALHAKGYTETPPPHGGPPPQLQEGT
jgi:hypothetical protein